MTHTLSVIDHAENHTYHQPTFEETDLNDPIAHCDLIDAAQPSVRHPPRLCRAHPAAQVLVYVPLQVGLQLRVELVLLAPPAQHVDQSRDPRSNTVHPVSFDARNFARMALACAQSSVARASCRRPARVSL